MHSVSLELARPRHQRGGQRVRAGDHLAAGLAQLQRERRVEHVGGGEAVVDPAARLADRRRETTSTNAATSWSVTCSRSRTASRSGGGAGLDLLEVVRRDHSLLGERLADRELDLQPGLELALLRPHQRHLGRV